MYTLTAILENPNGGNYNSGTLAGLTGSVSMSASVIQAKVLRGTGTLYVVVN